MYTPLDINRENLTIMGIEFPDLKALESTANAIGSNMFEGFEPTSKGIEIIRDYSTGKNKNRTANSTLPIGGVSSQLDSFVVAEVQFSEPTFVLKSPPIANLQTVGSHF